MRILPLLAVGLPFLAGGCLAKTAYTVATAPIKAGGQVVDWTTTSQDEADRNYGRKMRQKETREDEARRKREKRCRDRPDDNECRQYSGYRAGADE